MDNTMIENINTKKSKELFEYEMTEVILKLKGEFAVVSKKDAAFQDINVEKEITKINIAEIPDIKRENNITVNIPENEISISNAEFIVETESVRATVPSISFFKLKSTSRSNISRTVVDDISMQKKDAILKFNSIESSFKNLHFQKDVKGKLFSETIDYDGITIPKSLNVGSCGTRSKTSADIDALSIEMPMLPTAVDIREISKPSVVELHFHLPKINETNSCSIKEVDFKETEKGKLPNIPTVKMQGPIFIKDQMRSISAPVVGSVTVKNSSYSVQIDCSDIRTPRIKRPSLSKGIERINVGTYPHSYIPDSKFVRVSVHTSQFVPFKVSTPKITPFHTLKYEKHSLQTDDQLYEQVLSNGYMINSNKPDVTQQIKDIISLAIQQ